MDNLSELFTPSNLQVLGGLIVQVFIISYLLAWLWQRIVGTQAERLVKGVLVLAAIWGLASFFKLTLITSLLHTFVPVALIALVIIFQPELRRGLGHLGRMQTFKLDWSLSDSADQARGKRDVDQIISAVRELSRSKTGALIVIEPKLGDRDYLSPGTTVNADISSTLLLTIFFTNSPLHDGAVIIRQNKIVAAGVILPMTEDPQLSYKYGTRHRAAIGLSELYDGLCIVVSEETGAISAATRGMLQKYKSADDLKNPLMYLYFQGGDSKVPTPMTNLFTMFGRGKADGDLPEEVEKTSASPASAGDGAREQAARIGSSRSRTNIPAVSETDIELASGLHRTLSDPTKAKGKSSGSSEGYEDGLPEEVSSAS